VIQKAVALIAAEMPESIAHSALAQALVTPVDMMDEHTKIRLAALLA